MIRCRLCVMPDTRPDTPFVDGICAACIAYAKRPKDTTAARVHGTEQLDLLLEQGKNGSGFDCIVPSSGGKDSHYQVLKLIERGARPLVVTASTCHLTPIGRLNLDNLARYATTIEVTPNRTVRAKLNRLGLEMVGDVSWPEHVSIFTTPFRVAADLGIPLLFYGENPQNQYGGPAGSEEALQLTRRWRSEFGGFLGLRPADMVGQLEISERDMSDYEMPKVTERPIARRAHYELGMGSGTLEIWAPEIEAHFLGQYLPWDSHENAKAAFQAGMHQSLPSPANYWRHENLDNAQTGLHDHMMYRKYGYGRGCAQLAVDVRAGRVTRAEAMDWIREYDGLFPFTYAGVNAKTMLQRIGLSLGKLEPLLARFTNAEFFAGERDLRPILKEFT
jgi:N-acetyl sugar amidotransferase